MKKLRFNLNFNFNRKEVLSPLKCPGEVEISITYLKSFLCYNFTLLQNLVTAKLSLLKCRDPTIRNSIIQFFYSITEYDKKLRSKFFTLLLEGPKKYGRACKKPKILCRRCATMEQHLKTILRNQ